MIFVIKRTKTIIWDFDDDISCSKEITSFENKLLESNADTIVVTGSILKKRLPKNIQSRVKILPTTDGQMVRNDSITLINQRKNSYNKAIELLWLATATSLPFLEKIIDELEKAGEIILAKYQKKLTLHVVCNKPLNYIGKNFFIDNVEWSEQSAHQMMIQSHIGLMPLLDTDFCRAKGGFKLLQYKAAALPSVASAIGINTMYVNDGIDGFLIGKNYPNSWSSAIVHLADNWTRYSIMSENARDNWDNNYSFNNNLEQWKLMLQ
ncbi:glycosyltransferase [Bifidobacterium olomucense]|nr:glycosyltransferase [Bifidobacterium sp. DSM 109959]